MTNPKWEEIILVAPRSEVFFNETLTFQGTETGIGKVERIVANIGDSITTMRRGNEKDDTPAENNAERNFDFIQPIPYAVIRRGRELFLYERLGGGGETRLQSKLSLGAGGHMNPIEDAADFDEVLEVNLARELEEELFISDKNKVITPVGLINDDSDDVNKVHIAVLTMIDVSLCSEVTVRETDQLDGRFVKIEDLKKPEIYDRLEAWSKIVVDTL